MVLQVTQDEIKLLSEVLQQAAVREPICGNLLERVRRDDLRFCSDDLEILSDFLADTSRRLYDQLMRGEDAAIRRRHEATRRLLDKVIEAEAMV